MVKKKADYNEESIAVLEGVVAVKKRPGMFIHDKEDDGFHQLFSEMLDNSVDEHLAGHCDTIDVCLDLEEQTFKVSDNGRGIPAGKHKKTGKSTLTTIFTVLHAGGKFDNQAYAVSGGLHGVGSTVVNALSEVMTVESKRGKWKYSQQFDQGIERKKVRKQKGDGSSGTTVFFKPDPTVFENASINPLLIRTRLEEVAFVCPELTLTLTVDGGKKKVYKRRKGLAGLIAKYNKANDFTTMHEPVSIKDGNVEAAFCWTDGEGEKWFNFVNVTSVKEGGTQVKGVRKAITRVLASKSKETILGDDLREGLVVALHVKVSDPMFKGQTKTKLLNSETEKETYKALLPILTKLFDEHEDLAVDILKRAVRLKKARADFKKLRKSIRDVTTTRSKGMLPGKLAEAPKCSPEERELFIVEGDSAGGTAKLARDNYYQEVLPLRGKVINTKRYKDSVVLKNAEIQSIMAAIGCGINHEVGAGCDPTRSRVGKVILLMDADPDGWHIAALVLTFLIEYMEELIDSGMVYVIKPPLFLGYWGGRRVFGNTVQELMDQLPKRATKKTVRVLRLKGHGEANPDDLEKYAMDPKTREVVLIKLKRKDHKRVQMLMGPDARFRKKILGVKEDWS